MELTKSQIKLIVTKDMMFIAPLWALLILVIWSAIAFVMIWTLLNIVKPSIDQKIENNKKGTYLISCERELFAKT